MAFSSSSTPLAAPRVNRKEDFQLLFGFVLHFSAHRENERKIAQQLHKLLDVAHARN
jgi:hypothetical protein